MSKNQILGMISEGRYELAWQTYIGLGQAMPEDNRYGGIALINLGKLTEAKDLLLTAIGRGCWAANIELATAYRMLGKFGLAEDALEKLDWQTLSPRDMCLFYREHGVLELEMGTLKSAINYLEWAWESSFKAEDGHTIRPNIAFSLGSAHADYGLDVQAAEYFDQALATARASRKPYVHLIRARSYAYSGRLDEAEEDLKAVEKGLGLARPLASTLYYNLALLERVKGNDLQEAAKGFIQAKTAAQESKSPDVQAYAELALCAVYLELGELAAARQNLAHAKMGVSSERARAHMLMRQGILDVALGSENALTTLNDAAAIFERLQLRRELGWTYLHIANYHIQSGTLAAGEEALNRATDVRFALGNKTMMNVELRSLPELLEHLASLEREHYAYILYEDYLAREVAVPKQVRLITLGQSLLLVDGEPVRLTIARALEIMTYLLTNPASTLENIRATLFPDTDPRLAKNYFHQARYDLESAVPGMKIPYNRGSRSYSVIWEEFSLTWDVADLKYALNKEEGDSVRQALALYTGPFLPQAESEWVEMERENLAWMALKAGLQLIESWYGEERYTDCLTLAERLRDLEPYNEIVAVYIVEATKHLEGAVAAQLKAELLCQQFERELGDVPSKLAAIRRDFGHIN